MELIKTEDKEIDFGKLIPIGTGWLILLGITKLIIYYSYFGINIVSFLDFGEIITSFLDVVVATVFVLATSWAQYIKVPMKPEPEPTNEKEKEEQLKRSLRSSRIGLWASVLVVVVNAIFLYNILSEWIARNWKSFLVFMFVGGLGTIATFAFYRLSKKQISKIKRQLAIATMLFVASYTLIVLTAISDYMEAKHNHKYLGTKITFSDKKFLADTTHTIISDSCNYYIGKTNNYIFVHHVKDGTTSVYPMSNVLAIDLKTKQSEKSWFQRFVD